MTAKRASPKPYPKYRCSECGRGSMDVVLRDGVAPVALACREHPAAPMLSWNSASQAAALWVHRVGEETARAALEDDMDPSRRALLVVALQVMEPWGFQLPEWRLPAIVTPIRPVTPIGLYGARP
ncbi:MAG: hypothetical protein HY873_13235 [Chloroflexi bacterium]|nr:hypothetical protein [Chloroflexota bacterium]